MEAPQRDRKAALHASQSREARLGQLAGTMAVEQLPLLCLSRERFGAGQRPDAEATVFSHSTKSVLSGAPSSFFCRGLYCSLEIVWATRPRATPPVAIPPLYVA